MSTVAKRFDKKQGLPRDPVLSVHFFVYWEQGEGVEATVLTSCYNSDFSTRTF